MIRYLKRQYRRLKRMWDFAKFGADNYDYDFGFVFKLLHFKLKRLKDALDKGFAIQGSEDMEALRRAIKITGRLSRDRYGDWLFRRHERKWGARPPLETENSVVIFKPRANVKTKDDEENERKDLMEIGAKEKALWEGDLDELFRIFKNHGGTWWD